MVFGNLLQIASSSSSSESDHGGDSGDSVPLRRAASDEVTGNNAMISGSTDMLFLHGSSCHRKKNQQVTGSHNNDSPDCPARSRRRERNGDFNSSNDDNGGDSENNDQEYLVRRNIINDIEQCQNDEQQEQRHGGHHHHRSGARRSCYQNSTGCSKRTIFGASALLMGVFIISFAVIQLILNHGDTNNINQRSAFFWNNLELKDEDPSFAEESSKVEELKTSTSLCSKSDLNCTTAAAAAAAAAAADDWSKEYNLNNATDADGDDNSDDDAAERTDRLYYDEENDDDSSNSIDQSSEFDKENENENRPIPPLYPFGDDQEDIILPKVAWLMSFPNSGTSFTLGNIRSVTQMRTAGNYCDDGKTIPPSIYPYEDVMAPHFIKNYQNYETPASYILTKTHCGGRCQECKAQDYIIHELEEFESECLKTCLGRYDNGTQIHDFYDIDMVQKAVHLFRHPFDNIISRFHLHYKHSVKFNNVLDLARHPKSIGGYRQYCYDVDRKNKLYKSDKKEYSKRLWNLAKKIPCHADLYRYVQWHNLVFEMIHKHNITTHIIHYEDYHENFHETTLKLVQFLEQRWSGPAKDFYWSDYSQYYTEEEKLHGRQFVKTLASKDTWRQLQRYFPRTKTTQENDEANTRN